MKSRSDGLPPLEAGLLRCLQALDNQVAREMQRTPAERDLHGVQKWEPYNKRVEIVAGFLAEQLGKGELELDGVLILTQALSKALSLYSDELGADGLGKIRSEYVVQVGQALSSDARRLCSMVPQTVLM
jgi:hypothetical protein